MRATAIVRDRNTKHGAMPVDFRITAMSSDDLEEWHREVRQITDSVSEHLVAKYSDKDYEKKHLEFEYDRQSFQVEQSHDNEDLEHLKGQVWFTPISPMDAGFPPCRRRCCASPDETKERQRILIIILAVFFVSWPCCYFFRVLVLILVHTWGFPLWRTCWRTQQLKSGALTASNEQYRTLSTEKIQRN